MCILICIPIRCDLQLKVNPPNTKHNSWHHKNKKATGNQNFTNGTAYSAVILSMLLKQIIRKFTTLHIKPSPADCLLCCELNVTYMSWVNIFVLYGIYFVFYSCCLPQQYFQRFQSVCWCLFHINLLRDDSQHSCCHRRIEVSAFYLDSCWLLQLSIYWSFDLVFWWQRNNNPRQPSSWQCFLLNV